MHYLSPTIITKSKTCCRKEKTLTEKLTWKEKKKHHKTTGRIKHCNKIIYCIAFFDKCSIDINVLVYEKSENFRKVYHFTLTLNENAYTTLTCFETLYLHITTNESSTNDVFRGYR